MEFRKREGEMLGRNQWPEKNLRSCKDVTLEDTKISDHGSNGGNVDVAENFSTVDPMLCDSSDATHDSVYNYSIDNIENSLTFLDDGDQESNDLLYGWGDIGNFEDVDNMLRICDSTFGFDTLNNEDDMCWFSSAQPNEDTETAMTDDIKPDIMLGNQITSMLQVEDILNNSESNNAVSYSHFNFEQPSAQVSPCESKSGIKSENKPNPSSASNESYTSNQAQSVESLQGSTVNNQCKKGFITRVNLQPGKDMPPFAMVFSDTDPIQKIGLENDHRKAADELKTSNMHESSCASSVVDDISLEATSLRLLQQVIEQLDVGTKLCIRDSLYRLAKSAAQRHNCNGGNRQKKGEDKYGFIDMETDTNPIDRTIAHLLFHRPSDSSLSLDNNVFSHKTHPMISQQNISPSLRIRKQEETSELKTETEVVISEQQIIM